jgi:hypothetical protein
MVAKTVMSIAEAAPTTMPAIVPGTSFFFFCLTLLLLLWLLSLSVDEW